MRVLYPPGALAPRQFAMDEQRTRSLLSVDGRVALVTGAGQGVGRQVALHLADHGALVAINDFFPDRARGVVEEILLQGGKAVAVAADVSDYSAVEAMIDGLTVDHGGVDILVNNAGGQGPHPAVVNDVMKPFWETTPADWERTLAPNFYGVLNCTRHVLKGMVARRRGAIVTVISEAGRYGDARLEAYAGSKAGAAGIMRSVARGTGRYGVRANCVAIALTRTDATVELFADKEGMEKTMSLYPLRRVGEPTDVANAVLFLASDAAAFVTGQVLGVNGGFHFTL